MEKLIAMHIAAQLTQAASGGDVPISPDLSDATVRAKNLHVWETFRVFHHAVVKAAADASWPTPKMTASQLLPNLAQSLLPLLSTGPIADIIQKLLASLPATTPSPLPNPG
ncbi:MAG: hypothetical protein L0Y72_19970 [Gemmataceae bacterium]|nr:hypothetical protein [Gemmataceae bacterium]MCI0741314.1 hypothetical protein [Gemmataceae bacterium]